MDYNMYKVEYQQVKADKDKNMSLVHNSEEIYRFSTDIERIEDMIKWIFENTTGRFYVLGTDTIYFENEEDAVAFKLGWS